MNTKLTLSIDKTIIHKAKKYAVSRQVSLSKLVEEYLKSLSSRSQDSMNIAPITKELGRVIKSRPTINYRHALEEALIDKHVK